MTLDQLRIFVEVADRSHITRAAEKLNMTPSAVSSAINALESRHAVKLFDRIGSKLKAPSSFSFALHGYDSVLLVAEAMKQAKSTDGSAVRLALEDLKTPVQGVLKTYEKPFSKASHEALTAKDLVWIKWKDGKLMPYTDALIGSLKPADFKQ